MSRYEIAVDLVQEMAAIECLRGGSCCFDDDLIVVCWRTYGDEMGYVWVRVPDESSRKAAETAVDRGIRERRDEIRKTVADFGHPGDPELQPRGAQVIRSRLQSLDAAMAA